MQVARIGAPPGLAFAAAVSAYAAGDVALLQQHASNPPLRSAPAVHLRRPYLLVPGWGLPLERYRHLLGRLGTVYYVRGGKVFRDPEGRRPAGPEARAGRVFMEVPLDLRAAPPQRARELGRNLSAVRRLTGARRVDVEAYSLGGLAARLYLDQGGQDIGRLLLVGVPNRGLRMAELAREVLVRDVRWAVALAGLFPVDREALEWMIPEEANPFLSRLNRNWPRQRRRLEKVEVVGASGTPTPGPDYPWRFVGGDGMVPAFRIGLPDLPTRVLPRPLHHRHLFEDPEIDRERVRFFGWEEIDRGH